MEIVFSEDLFLPEIPVEERAKHWVLIFSTFDDNDKKALQAILSQKQRWAQLLKLLSLILVMRTVFSCSTCSGQKICPSIHDTRSFATLQVLKSYRI